MSWCAASTRDRSSRGSAGRPRGATPSGRSFISLSTTSSSSRDSPGPRLLQEASQQTAEFRRAKQGLSQLGQILLIHDEGRALKAAAVVVVAEADLVGPLRLALQKAQELNRGDMVGRRDLHLFFDDSASPVE